MDPLNTRQTRIRQRFAVSDPDEGKSTLRSLLRFVGLALEKADRDGLLMRSAALAFVTIVSLVPLLAGLSYFSIGFFTDRQGEMVDLLARVLPYTEATITSSLLDFLDKSRRLRGFGFIAFLLTALTAFSMIEKSINDIWEVPSRRSFRRRLSSFALLIFWGPLLIGAAYSGLFLLRQSPTLATLADELPLRAVIFIITLVGLAMLNWQVPNTHVHIHNALVGGAASALLLEALRGVFGYYVLLAQNQSIVYGSFGFALLFMISIQLSWAIVLVGTELAYCRQNFQAMSTLRRPAELVEGSWLALAAVILIMDRFRDRQPFTPDNWLAERLRLTPAELNHTLCPLVDAEYLRCHKGPLPGDGEGYLMSCDPYQTPLVEVLDLYEDQQWDILRALPDGASERLQTLRARLTDQRHLAAGDLMLAELMAQAEPDDADSEATEETP